MVSEAATRLCLFDLHAREGFSEVGVPLGQAFVELYPLILASGATLRLSS